MKIEKMILAIVALLLISGSLVAGDRRSRCNAACACAQAQQQATVSPAPAVVQPAQPTVTPVPKDAPTVTTVEAAGSCASGTCSSSSYSAPTRSRRGR